MKRSQRLVQGPSNCGHGWTVFARGHGGRLRCLYCLLEVTAELRRKGRR